MTLLLKDIKPGDVLIADRYFTCLSNGQEVTVEAYGNGDLFVRCANGNHDLEGQLNEAGEIMGLSRKVIQ